MGVDAWRSVGAHGSCGVWRCSYFNICDCVYCDDLGGVVGQTGLVVGLRVVDDVLRADRFRGDSFLVFGGESTIVVDEFVLGFRCWDCLVVGGSGWGVHRTLSCGQADSIE